MLCSVQVAAEGLGRVLEAANVAAAILKQVQAHHTSTWKDAKLAACKLCRACLASAVTKAVASRHASVGRSKGGGRSSGGLKSKRFCSADSVLSTCITRCPEAISPEHASRQDSTYQWW